MAIYIKNLKVNNFKCIKELEFKELGSINLIAGESGCGKSAILELIDFLENPDSISKLSYMLKMVNGPKYNLKDYKELIYGEYNPEKNNNFSCSYNENQVNVKIKMQKKNFSIITDLKNLEQETSKKVIFDSFPVTFCSRDKVYEKERFREKNKNLPLYVDSGLNTTNIQEVIETPKTRDVILSLLKLSNEDISKISITKRSGEIVAFDSFLNKTIPLKLLGDSITKAIYILNTLLKAKGHVLLLEDFDSSFSPKAKDILFPVIKELIREYKIQAFFTTNNEETLFKMLNEEDDSISDIKIHTMYSYEHKNYVRTLDGKTAHKASSDMGLSLI